MSPSFFSLHKFSSLVVEFQKRLWARRRQRRSLSKGSQKDFFTYRPYAYGDDWRTLDWTLYARLGTPYVKEWATFEEHFCTFYLDESPSLGVLPEKRSLARELILLLFLLSSFSARESKIIPLESPLPLFRYRFHKYSLRALVQGAQAVTQYFLQSPAPPRTPFSSPSFSLSPLQGKPHAFAISDFYWPESYLLAFLSKIASAHADLHLIQLLHKKETHFEAPSLPLRLVDSETGEILMLRHRSQILEYQKNLKRFQDTLHHLCRQRGFHYLPLVLPRDAYQVVQGWIAQGLLDSLIH